MASDDGVHPLQITPWQQVAWEGLPTLLSHRRGPKDNVDEALTAA